jgi:predicted nucleic acid-binding protein
MIRLVVDASVAVKWVLKEPDSDAARRIAEQAELLAPDLLWAELGSLLWRRQRQGELSASDARGMLLTLRAFPVRPTGCSRSCRWHWRLPSRSVTASTTVSIWRSPIGRTAAW